MVLFFLCCRFMVEIRGLPFLWPQSLGGCMILVSLVWVIVMFVISWKKYRLSFDVKLFCFTYPNSPLKARAQNRFTMLKRQAINASVCVNLVSWIRNRPVSKYISKIRDFLPLEVFRYVRFWGRKTQVWLFVLSSRLGLESEFYDVALNHSWNRPNLTNFQAAQKKRNNASLKAITYPLYFGWKMLKKS